MSNSIIEVNNLSKSYTISHEGRERYTALRDVLAQKAKKIFSFPASLRGGSRLLSGKQSPYKEEFWALKDVSFKIEQGDRVGIIGRNGAGKSTLLKILSRIVEPTAGEIKIKGRVASLLEVGTGFHPELTGRENIFLNGAILGMSRAEIKKHFDAIVDFAEVEKFLDTPVKRYSSGMYVRLAFAVAAHLEPEILVIDEVLAVGDAQFQKKCLGKMEDVSKNEGRTVLFVSHNMAALNSLTTSSVLLENGKMVLFGETKHAISKYSTTSSLNQNEMHFLTKGKYASIISIELYDENIKKTFQFSSGAPMTVRVLIDNFSGLGNLSFDLFLKDFLDNRIGFYSCALTDGVTLLKTNQQQIFEAKIEMPFLASGDYYFDIFTAVTNVQWDQKIEKAVKFTIINSSPKGQSFDFSHSLNYGVFTFKTLSIRQVIQDI